MRGFLKVNLIIFFLVLFCNQARGQIDWRKKLEQDVKDVIAITKEKVKETSVSTSLKPYNMNKGLLNYGSRISRANFTYMEALKSMQEVPNIYSPKEDGFLLEVVNLDFAGLDWEESYKVKNYSNENSNCKLYKLDSFYIPVRSDTLYTHERFGYVVKDFQVKKIKQNINLEFFNYIEKTVSVLKLNTIATREIYSFTESALKLIGEFEFGGIALDSYIKEVNRKNNTSISLEKWSDAASAKVLELDASLKMLEKLQKDVKSAESFLRGTLHIMNTKSIAELLASLDNIKIALTQASSYYEDTKAKNVEAFIGIAELKYLKDIPGFSFLVDYQIQNLALFDRYIEFFAEQSGQVSELIRDLRILGLSEGDLMQELQIALMNKVRKTNPFTGGYLGFYKTLRRVPEDLQHETSRKLKVKLKNLGQAAQNVKIAAHQSVNELSGAIINLDQAYERLQLREIHDFYSAAYATLDDMRWFGGDYHKELMPNVDRSLAAAEGRPNRLGQLKTYNERLMTLKEEVNTANTMAGTLITLVLSLISILTYKLVKK